MYIVGLMSGTSCDGIDAALVRIDGSGTGSRVRLLEFRTFPYPAELKARLMAPRLNARDVCLLNFELGERLAEAVLAMKQIADKLNIRVDLVASHGHTVAHHPPAGNEKTCGTLQIGEAAVIAERTGLAVVSDFRPRDMAAGGQGAPLVPYADWLLFRREDRTLACLNIGGIANITLVPPELEGVMAFDTGPGNMIIDGAMRWLTKGAQEMDREGEAASRGKVIPKMRDRLLAHPYFQLEPPKSAGREQFGLQVYLGEVLAGNEAHPFDDIVATVTSVTARSIIGAIDRFIRPRFAPERLIVSGGGAHNQTLLNLLREGLPDILVATSDEHGIPADAREAVAFAILGSETMNNRPANVPGATGASHSVILGKITPV